MSTAFLAICAFYLVIGAPLLLLAGLWSSAGYALLDGAAVAYAARWAA